MNLTSLLGSSSRGSSWTFDPLGMNAALDQGFVASVKAAQALAMELRPSKRMIPGVSIVNMTSTVATLKGRGLSAVFESGRKGGGDIYPGGVKGYRRSFSRKHGIGVVRYRGTGRGRAQTQAMLASSGPLAGQFFGHVTEGPMEPIPFLRPTAEAWAHGLYQGSARATMTGAGYSAFRTFV